MKITNDILIQSLEASNLAHTISLIEDDFPMRYANQAFLDLTGYGHEEVIGRNCRFLQGEGTDPEAVGKIREAVKNFEAIDIELLNYKKDGTPFWNRLRMAPVFDADGKPSAFIGIQSDVTHIREKERIERERQKLEALGRMSANVSHEIKNTLQPIKLMSDLLQDRQDMDEAQMTKCLNIIHDAVGMADSAVKDILLFSRTTSDEVNDIPVEQLSKEMEHFTRNLMNSRIHFVAETADFDEEKRFVSINKNQLSQVVLNIVNNALHAMNEKGWFTFGCDMYQCGKEHALELKIPEGEYLCMSFQDDGKGIDEKTMQSIFDPFFSTKPPGEGTGLGLSISQKLVRKWGGVIYAHSTKGKGSVFSVLLPVV